MENIYKSRGWPDRPNCGRWYPLTARRRPRPPIPFRVWTSLLAAPHSFATAKTSRRAGDSAEGWATAATLSPSTLPTMSSGAAAGTSRSEVPAQSKDLYPRMRLGNLYVIEFKVSRQALDNPPLTFL